jgi:hypothetical protein
VRNNTEWGTFSAIPVLATIQVLGNHAAAMAVSSLHIIARNGLELN